MSGATRVPFPGRPTVFAYGAITLFGSPFQEDSANCGFCNSPSPWVLGSGRAPLPPGRNAHPLLRAHEFRLLPFRSPLLRESLLLSFPRGTEMFHFPRCRLPHCCGISAFEAEGFPHSEIPGSTVVCTSPGLIAAYHVLHRLPVPRHPPGALSILPYHLQPPI